MLVECSKDENKEFSCVSPNTGIQEMMWEATVTYIFSPLAACPVFILT